MDQEVLQGIHKTSDVTIIQRRIQFVKQTEGRGFNQEDGKEQRHRRHGAFATREQANRLRLLSGRTGNDVNTAFQRIFRIFQEDQPRFAAMEETGKHLFKVRVGPFEGLAHRR